MRIHETQFYNKKNAADTIVDSNKWVATIRWNELDEIPNKAAMDNGYYISMKMMLK